MSVELSIEKSYSEFLQLLKERIATAQTKAALSVNRELILLYWQIGREILERQNAQGWGAKVVEQLSKDLRSAFPDMKGFSRANLLYMRAFAEAYPDDQFVQQVVGQIPWGHNIRILDKTETLEEREFYIRKTIENGWSRNILVLQIESKLFERQGKAVTNFELTLPKPQSDLANQLLKDPYNFDFLTLHDVEVIKAREKYGNIEFPIENNIPILFEIFEKNQTDERMSVLFRLEALAKLIDIGELPKEWILNSSDGTVSIIEPILFVAATHPLVIKDEKLVFEKNSFFKKVQELLDSDYIEK